MDKRERIIQAAIDSFIEKGIEKTTISDIAALADIAQGTFYLYFPSKLSIMPSIAEVLVDKIHDGLINNVKDGTFESELKTSIDIIFNISRDYKELATIIYSGLTQSEQIKGWGDIYSPVYQWMSDFLVKHQENGTIRPSINIDHSSRIIITFIESTAEQIYLYEGLDVNKVTEHKEEVFEFIKRGLGIYE